MFHCPTIFPSDVQCFQLLGSKGVAAETQRAVKSLPNPGSLPYLTGNQTCGNRQFPSANEFPSYKPPFFFGDFPWLCLKHQTKYLLNSRSHSSAAQSTGIGWGTANSRWHLSAKLLGIDSLDVDFGLPLDYSMTIVTVARNRQSYRYRHNTCEWTRKM